MFKKSFFNPFSTLLLILAGLAFLVDVMPRPRSEADVFAPVVLLLMWLAGGLVRLFYEDEASRTFKRHMAKADHAMVWKRDDGIWNQVDANLLEPGDVIRLDAGMLCPVDVTVTEGNRLLASESSLTGESGLTVKAVGDTVRAGVTITDGQACATVLSKIAEKDSRVPTLESPGAKYGIGAKNVCLDLMRCMLILLPFVILIRGVMRGDWTQALLFALGTAVGLVPEMLPVVTGVCLSGGARRLKGRHVIVKSVDAMESLGSMDVVCVDKTGTLTEDVATLEYFTDILGNESPKTLGLAYLESTCQGMATNQLDRAISTACGSADFHFPAKDVAKAFSPVATDPFDHVSKASGVKLATTPDALDHLGIKGAASTQPIPAEQLITSNMPVPHKQPTPNSHLTIVKGEVEGVCARCAWADFKGELVPMDTAGLASALEIADDMRADGIKVLAVAYSTAKTGWDDLVLCGFLGFFDAPKASARDAVKALSNLSVEVRVLTGDSASVAKSTCSRLGIPSSNVVTGGAYAEMSESEALACVRKCRVFAELTPAQKAQIVELTRLSGHTVGYIGDGVNDVPALVAANVGIVVDSAAAESKRVADLVLLERDLGVVAEGVAEGKRAFANASKYIRIASSSNFGNICSVAAASVFLPFLPATAAQLLVLNLFYDAVCLALSWDNVDAEEISSPKTWSERGLGGFMGRFGLVSSAFDLITFAILFFVVCPMTCGAPYAALDPVGRAEFITLFQAGWLLECAWTESLVIPVLRTRRPDGSRPRRPLSLMICAMLTASALLTIGPAAPWFGLSPMPVWYLGIVALLSTLYLALVTVLKRAYLAGADSLF